MAANETTIITKETIVIETTERIVYRGPRRGPPALRMIMFALILAYFAIYTGCFAGPGYTLLAIILGLMSFSLLVGTYLNLED
jgi:hypothetical protein